MKDLTLAIDFAKRTRFPLRVAGILMLLRFVSMLFEGVGVAMILPIIEYIGHAGTPDELRGGSLFWEYIFVAFESVGVSVSLLSLMVVAVLAILLRQIFQYAFEVLNIRSVHNYVRDIQISTFENAMRSRIEEVETRSEGYFVNIIVTEAVRAGSLVWAVLPFATSAILFVAYFISLFVISTALALALLAAFIVNAGVMVGLMRRTAKVGAAVTASNDALSTFIVSRIPFIRQSKLGGAESSELRQCAGTIGRLQHNMGQTKVLKARIPLIVQPFAVITILGLLYFGIETLSVPIAELILFCGITARVVPILQTLVLTVQGTVGVWASLKTTVSFFCKTDAQKESNDGIKPFPVLSEGIRFQGVEYAYPQSGTRAIENVTLLIPANRWTAIVGPSGSGKSTLIDLLPRLRDPERGQVLFDDVPANEIKLFELREQFAFVSQSPRILPGSYRDHITYGRDTIDDITIRDAARTVGLLEMIEGSPNGFETYLGDNANQLSGGQKQRLDLARALALDARIVILDEPTTGLDPEARHNLKGSLSAIVERGRTTLITISHDLDLVEDADQIILVMDGKIIASGVHAAMLEKSSWYREAAGGSNRSVVSPDEARDSDGRIGVAQPLEANETSH